MRLSEMRGENYARWESSYLTPRDVEDDDESGESDIGD